jgi:aryl-alcohol dehydrogenase-like predicted oxidoreductase
MHYRELGQTGLNVSVIGLGTMTYGEQNSEAEAHQQLAYAVAQGINFLDTAELYPVPPKAETQGRTEAYIGSWLKKHPEKRQEVILATKIVGPGEWVAYFRQGPRLNKSHIEQAVDASLRRLHTDYIDLYQVHWPARPTNYFGQLGYVYQQDNQEVDAIDDTLQALDAMIKKGKIRHIGVSNETAWGVAEWLKQAEKQNLARIVSIQNPYNLLNRSFEVALAEFSQREAVGLLAYSPLAFGVLTGKYLNNQKPDRARLTLFTRFSRYNSDQATAATQAYAALAREAGLSLTHLALAFVNQQPFVTSNLIGATTMAQLQENIASIQVQLSAEVLKKIEEIHKIYTYPCP